MDADANENANANADAGGSTTALREHCSGKLKRIRSKTTEKKWRHCFPHYKSMGAFCCHGNQSFDPIFPKTLCSLSPTPVMLHIKFDQDWPTGFRDIQVWKCGQRTMYDDGWRTDYGPLVYYKLTLWAFGSGELKMNTPSKIRLTLSKQSRNNKWSMLFMQTKSFGTNINLYKASDVFSSSKYLFFSMASINIQTRICFLCENWCPPPPIGVMQFCTESQVLVLQNGINSESK